MIANKVPGNLEGSEITLARETHMRTAFYFAVICLLLVARRAAAIDTNEPANDYVVTSTTNGVLITAESILVALPTANAGYGVVARMNGRWGLFYASVTNAPSVTNYVSRQVRMTFKPKPVVEMNDHRVSIVLRSVDVIRVENGTDAENPAATLRAIDICSTAVTSNGGDAPIPPGTLADWLRFDKPVTLECRELPKPEKERESNPFGDPLWEYDYSSKTQTLHSYSIALFPGGSIFRDKRKQMEAVIAQQMDKLKAISTGRHLGIAIQTRPDGRKVYFTVLGFGPGGTGYGAFTTLAGGTYDLLVTHNVDGEDVGQDQRLRNPAKPDKELTDVFGLIEERVNQIVSKKAANQVPEDTTRKLTEPQH